VKKDGKKKGDSGKLLKRVFQYVGKNYKYHLIFVLIGIFVSVLANVQGTMFMKTMIDDYIIPLTQAKVPDFAPFAWAIARVAGFYLIGVLCAYMYNKIMIYVTQGTLKNLRNDMFAKMESLPVKYFDTHPHGDIMSVYTNDIDTLRQMISQSIPQMISSFLTIVSVFISMLILNIPLTVVTVIMLGLMMLVTKKIAGLSGKHFMAQQVNIGKVNGYIEEMMEGQKVVKVFCHEEEAIEAFDKINNQLFESADNANKFANYLGPVNAQLGNINYVVCAVVGGVLAINGIGGFTLGGLASFLTFNKSIAGPVNQISQQLNSIVMALAGAKRIFELMDEKPEEDNGYVELVYAKKENGEIKESKERTGHWAWKHYHQADGTTTYVEQQGDVVLDGVDFGYTDEKIVLHDIKLYAKPGEKIAFVGSTGAGKTTITNLYQQYNNKLTKVGPVGRRIMQHQTCHTDC
jgi:ATP-binding cassette, subfamily B, multidrug efflux pump